MADYPHWQKTRLESVLRYSRYAMLIGAHQREKSTLACTLIPDSHPAGAYRAGFCIGRG